MSAQPTLPWPGEPEWDAFVDWYAVAVNELIPHYRRQWMLQRGVPAPLAPLLTLDEQRGDASSAFFRAAIRRTIMIDAAFVFGLTAYPPQVESPQHCGMDPFDRYYAAVGITESWPDVSLLQDWGRKDAISIWHLATFWYGVGLTHFPSATALAFSLRDLPRDARDTMLALSV